MLNQSTVWPKGRDPLTGNILDREGSQGLQIYGIDTLPEWSKGVDSSSTSASCVGSNPTAVILDVWVVSAHARHWPPARRPNISAKLCCGTSLLWAMRERRLWEQWYAGAVAVHGSRGRMQEWRRGQHLPPAGPPHHGAESAHTKRQRGDSNPCGQSPMDF